MIILSLYSNPYTWKGLTIRMEKKCFPLRKTEMLLPTSQVSERHEFYRCINILEIKKHPTSHMFIPSFGNVYKDFIIHESHQGN